MFFFGKKCIVFCLIVFPFRTYAQLHLEGSVVDNKGNGLFAVNVFIKDNPSIGTVSGMEGDFSFEIPEENRQDTLQFSCIGYVSEFVAVEHVEKEQRFVIELREDYDVLKEIVIRANDPIAEEFSVKQLKRLDIYNNPIASADPLRAIGALPASTNTDESANVSLRGSDASRSTVVLNRVPIRNPVRSTQINGMGNFSLFNTEMIDKQLVYASNPPVTYGNASAGLVEIETRRKVVNNAVRFSAGLAHVGFLGSFRKKEDNFIQVYGNYQFSGGFTKLNGKNVEDVNAFETKDVGLNIHKTVGSRWSFTLYSYFIDESANIDTRMLNFSGTSVSDRRRAFNVFNARFQWGSSVFRFNHGNDFARSDFTSGNIDSDRSDREYYYSLDYEHFIKESVTIQSGVSYNRLYSHFKGKEPKFYFALAPESPTLPVDTTIHNGNLESYLYTKFESSRLVVAGGVRKNIPVENQNNYTSFQGSVRLEPFDGNSFLFSGGRYHNYNTPNPLDKNLALLSSDQFAFEYTYAHSNFEWQMASFLKKEKGKILPGDDSRLVELTAVETRGIELGVGKHWSELFNTSFSYTFLDRHGDFNGETYRMTNDLDYIVKASIAYTNLKIANITLYYTTWQGKYYTPVTGAVFRDEIERYEPLFDDERNSAQFPTYHSLNLSLNKVTVLEKSLLISYLSVKNLLNRNNPRSVIYNDDFSGAGFNFLQKRAIYFGAVWKLNR